MRFGKRHVDDNYKNQIDEECPTFHHFIESSLHQMDCEGGDKDSDDGGITSPIGQLVSNKASVAPTKGEIKEALKGKINASSSEEED